METAEADLKKHRQIGIDCKGDIYLCLAKNQNHPFVKKMGIKGPVFQIVRRNTDFVEWEVSQIHFFWLGMLIPVDDYYDIESDALGGFTESSLSAPEMVGIFVPRHIDKKSVAESLRERFGSGAILLKEDEYSQPEGMARE